MVFDEKFNYFFNSWLYKTDKTNTIRFNIPHKGKKYQLNPFKLNGISHSYQLDQSVSILRVVGWYFSSFFKS